VVFRLVPLKSINPIPKLTYSLLVPIAMAINNKPIQARASSILL
jgi:hypothetical protein